MLSWPRILWIFSFASLAKIVLGFLRGRQISSFGNPPPESITSESSFDLFTSSLPVHQDIDPTKSAYHFNDADRLGRKLLHKEGSSCQQSQLLYPMKPKPSKIESHQTSQTQKESLFQTTNTYSNEPQNDKTISHVNSPSNAHRNKKATILQPPHFQPSQGAVRKPNVQFHSPNPIVPQQSHQQAHHHQQHSAKHISAKIDNSTLEELARPIQTFWSSLNPHNRIVAFYNLFIGNKDIYPAIVEEQLELMKMTGLLHRLDVVYYVTVGNRFESMPSNLQDLLVNTTKSAVVENNGDIWNTNHQSRDYPNYDKKTNGKANNITYPMFVQVRNTMKSVDESLTLSYLYDFCEKNPHSQVLYFHNKGSYHNSPENLYFRQFLDCYVLNPQCIDALENGFDTCGWRLSPFPSPHYSGNFWWARCDYVRKLVHPGSMVLNSTFAELTKSLSKAVVSHDRYFAETWVASHPRVNPADCMDHEVDTSFFCCYDLSEVSPRQCPNHVKYWMPLVEEEILVGDKYGTLLRPMIREKILATIQNRSMSADTDRDWNGVLEIGGKCKAADVFAHGEYYVKTYAKKRGSTEYFYHVDLVDEIRKRSMIWYGLEPRTLLKAVDRLVPVPVLPLKAVIVDPNNHMPSFYYENGSIFDSFSNEFEMSAYIKDMPHILMYSFMVDKLRISSNSSHAKL